MGRAAGLLEDVKRCRVKYADLFLSCKGNIIPVVRGIAEGMDEHEEWLERARVALGFREDWSPSHDRRIRSGATAPSKWADRFATVNGRGDFGTLLGEVCAWMDMMEAKKGEIAAKLDADDDDGFRVVGGSIDPDFRNGKNGTEPAACPKCGKTGRGLAMHMKHCGKAA